MAPAARPIQTRLQLKHLNRAVEASIACFLKDFDCGRLPQLLTGELAPLSLFQGEIGVNPGGN